MFGLCVNDSIWSRWTFDVPSAGIKTNPYIPSSWALSSPASSAPPVSPLVAAQIKVGVTTLHGVGYFLIGSSFHINNTLKFHTKVYIELYTHLRSFYLT